MKNINEVMAAIEAQKTRSAWSRGVKDYAIELLEDLQEYEAWGDFSAAKCEGRKELEAAMLNGAHDWKQYSWGGLALIYDVQIAERLCTASELKKTENGAKKPNARENWLDTQARALYQACAMIKNAAF